MPYKTPIVIGFLMLFNQKGVWKERGEIMLIEWAWCNLVLSQETCKTFSFSQKSNLLAFHFPPPPETSKSSKTCKTQRRATKKYRDWFS